MLPLCLKFEDKNFEDKYLSNIRMGSVMET
jgi:hypothetical protein